MPQLVANPVQELQQNTVDFLKDHLIIASFLPTENGYFTPGPLQFRLEYVDNATRPGRVLGLCREHDTDYYYLKRDTGPAGPNTFMAYWVPYQDNTAHAVNLGVAAQLTFTARMDACAFGYTNFPNGVTVACHANAQNGTGQFDDATAAHMIAPCDRKLAREDYKTSKFTPAVDNAQVACTTIGLRNGSDWKFYFQKYEINNMTYMYWGLDSF